MLPNISLDTNLPPSPADIETALRANTPSLPFLRLSFSFVLFVSDTEETTAYAVIDGKNCARLAGSDLVVNGWSVHLISADCPIGHAICFPPINLGDCITIRPQDGSASEQYRAQIVSWNGSPLLTAEQRDDGCRKQVTRNAAASLKAATKRKQIARRDKEDGIVAELRARRLAKEAALKTPRTGER